MDTMPHRTLAAALTLAGTLPFVAGAVQAWTGLVPGVDGVALARGYGAVIAAFVAGIHWGAYLFNGARCGVNLLAWSNVVALSAWVALLVPSARVGLVILVACFAALLWLDMRLHRNGVTPAWFNRLRIRATAIVVPALLVTAAY